MLIRSCKDTQGPVTGYLKRGPDKPKKQNRIKTKISRWNERIKEEEQGH